MIGYHIIAFLTVAIWGSTFVFTKILLQNGLSPAQIFTLRFIIAYVLMVICCKVMSPRLKWLSDTWLDEFVMLLLGITGGSLYFLTENASMLYTTATNATARCSSPERCFSTDSSPLHLIIYLSQDSRPSKSS